MLAAFARALSAARRASRAAAEDPVTAVHDYRKSLRRARSIVALLAPSIGRRGARALRERLHGAFSETGALRDASVLHAALDALPAEPDDDEAARRALREAYADAETRSRREAVGALERGAAALRPLPAALELLLDPQFSARDLERGLLRGRRRERRAFDGALDSREPADVHEWRKRLKELRYEIELLASTGTPPLKKRERRLAELAKDLGEATDAALLARDIAGRLERGAAPAGADALRTRAATVAAARTEPLLTRAATLFEDDPREFARRVVGERG